jgi:hypothetical protein
MYIDPDELTEDFVRQAFKNLSKAKEVIESLEWNAEVIAQRYLKLRGPELTVHKSYGYEHTIEDTDLDSSSFDYLDKNTLEVSFDIEEIRGTVIRIARCGCCGDETYATFAIPARYMWEEDWEDEVLKLKEEAIEKRIQIRQEREDEELRIAREEELELLASLQKKYGEVQKSD